MYQSTTLYTFNLPSVMYQIYSIKTNKHKNKQTITTKTTKNTSFHCSLLALWANTYLRSLQVLCSSFLKGNGNINPEVNKTKYHPFLLQLFTTIPCYKEKSYS